MDTKTVIVSVLMMAGFFSGLRAQHEGDSIYLKTWFESPAGFRQSLPEKGELTSYRRESGSPVMEFTFAIEADGDYWNPTVPAEGITVTLSVLTKIPDAVVAGSDKFRTSSWLSGITFHNFDFMSTFEFYFPILPPAVSYTRDDFYMVRLNDTLGVHCKMNEGGVFEGTFLTFRDAGDRQGNPVEIERALEIGSTDKNPFRFAGIAASSETEGFSNMEFCCGEGFYGIDIDTYVAFSVPLAQPLKKISPVPVIQFSRCWDIAGRLFVGDHSSSLHLLVQENGERVIMNSDSRKSRPVIGRFTR
jgi:hypothetical protein